ncbi:nucleotidyltransferase family protein [Streptomyces sp. NBC_00287]|uniref:nucleotidyltransferase family protein n=1 Tax=Streptomyces sp. NBC_00287 TaxID=2975702 RepID=UPI002E2DE946|nr:nucleotidyltransferase family protein [Streptomyces sp. NBC_00287]
MTSQAETLRILALAHVAPRIPREEAVEEVLRDEQKALAVLRANQVLSFAADRLAGSGRAPEGSVILAAAEAKRKERAHLEDLWSQIGEAVAEAGIPVAGIKGRAAVALYDDPGVRDFSDIDLMAGSIDDALALVEVLRRRGFEWWGNELPWVKRDRHTGRIYGQVPLDLVRGTERYGVDLHFSGYSIRHSRFLPVDVTGSGLHRWTPMENLPLLVGNAAGDFLIRQKDVNDVTLLLERSDQDWTPALDRIRSVGLGPFWNAILAATTRTAALSPEAAERAAGLTLTGVGRETPPFAMPDPRRRVRGTVLDAYRSGGGLLPGIRLAAGAYRYYRRPLRLTAVQSCRHRAPAAAPIRHLRNDVCVRLVPMDMVRTLDSGTAPEDALQQRTSSVPGSVRMRELHWSGHSFAQLNDELFAPTVLYDICPVQRDVAAADAKE